MELVRAFERWVLAAPLFRWMHTLEAWALTVPLVSRLLRLGMIKSLYWSAPEVLIFYPLYWTLTGFHEEWYWVWVWAASLPALTVNFFFQKHRVFEKGDSGQDKKEFLAFFVISVLLQAVENLLLKPAVDWFEYGPILTQFLIAAVFDTIGYGCKRWIIFGSN